MKPLLCVGSVSQDIFFPFPGMQIIDTPEDIMALQKVVFEFGAKYLIDDRYDAPGGCAANVVQGLALLGNQVACCGLVGDDSLGRQLKEDLESRGVDCRHIAYAQNSRTDIAFILIDQKSAERTIFYNRDTNEQFLFAIDREKSKEYSGVFLSGLSGDWEKSMHQIFDFIECGKLPLFLNPGQRNIQKNAHLIQQLIARARGLFVNKDEAIEIVFRLEKLDQNDPCLQDELCLLNKLQSYGPEFVALTDGARGAWAITPEKNVLFSQPQETQNKVDTTGAGDAFTSGFLAAFLQGKSFHEATQWGMVNSRSVIQFYGAQKGLVQYEDMEKQAGKVSVEMIAC